MARNHLILSMTYLPSMRNIYLYFILFYNLYIIINFFMTNKERIINFTNTKKDKYI